MEEEVAPGGENAMRCANADAPRTPPRAPRPSAAKRGALQPLQLPRGGSNASPLREMAARNAASLKAAAALKGAASTPPPGRRRAASSSNAASLRGAAALKSTMTTPPPGRRRAASSSSSGGGGSGGKPPVPRRFMDVTSPVGEYIRGLTPTVRSPSWTRRLQREQPPASRRARLPATLSAPDVRHCRSLPQVRSMPSMSSVPREQRAARCAVDSETDTSFDSDVELLPASPRLEQLLPASTKDASTSTSTSTLSPTTMATTTTMTMTSTSTSSTTTIATATTTTTAGTSTSTPNPAPPSTSASAHAALDLAARRQRIVATALVDSMLHSALRKRAAAAAASTSGSSSSSRGLSGGLRSGRASDRRRVVLPSSARDGRSVRRVDTPVPNALPRGESSPSAASPSQAERPGFAELSCPELLQAAQQLQGQQVARKGWLRLRGERRAGGEHAWRRRWVVVYNNLLLVYRSPEAPRPRVAALLDSAVVSLMPGPPPIEVVRDVDAISAAGAAAGAAAELSQVRVETRVGRVLLFRAENASMAAAWAAAISSAGYEQLLRRRVDLAAAMDEADYGPESCNQACAVL